MPEPAPQPEDVLTLALDLRPDDPDHAAAAVEAAADRLAAEADRVRGVVIELGEAEFYAGAALGELAGPCPPAAQRVLDAATRFKSALRRVETCGRPVVAALTGSALGGGLEIALACHHRIALDAPGSRFGLPEAGYGLVPAGGGVVRAVRLLGIADALQQVLLEGRRLAPARALDAGLLDEVVATREEITRRAMAFIDAHPEARQPWDTPGYRVPGGAPGDPALDAVLPSFPALLRRRTGGAPYRAPRDILAAAVEGAQVAFATAELVESRYAAGAATAQSARNMTRAFAVDLPAVNAGRSRPGGVPRRTAARVAVLGAGMMGAGIAQACAAAGLEVALKDVSEEAARRGRDRVAARLSAAVERGRTTPERREALLARIAPTGRAADLTGCDVVIEAVFEDPELKRAVFREVQHLVAPDALLCSNTSTLPITRLAEGVEGAERQADFLGLHFFSPVDRMPLVEIVRGERTGDAALARAFDLVRHLGKTPIVVKDARGFFTSRVIGCRLDEGAAMLGEGVPPASVEQAARQAGYPTGVLELLDEISLTLVRRIREENRAAAEAAGVAWHPHPAEAVIERMTDKLGRPGRAAGAGFYDYAEGRRTGLWPGLREHFGAPAAEGPEMGELRERLLFSEALAAVTLLEDGVVGSVADANVGSLLGIGFPAWTGGVLQYVDGYPGGPSAFVARARDLAERYGERFAPPAPLVAMAARGESFAGRALGVHHPA
jgi:3-hydroxyacyl-CoA dehydrogenase/enoyl-CoA hydratase/3-hydroxybutyryl-CoA epimerase